MKKNNAEAGGFEPPVRLPVRQFSKLVVSATHPNFQSQVVKTLSLKRGAKIDGLFDSCKHLNNFFPFFYCFSLIRTPSQYASFVDSQQSLDYISTVFPQTKDDFLTLSFQQTVVVTPFIRISVQYTLNGSPLSAHYCN